jgi:hypothetical protein
MIDFHHALLASLLIATIGLVACGTDSPATRQSQTTLTQPETDSTPGRILAITRVKTPWHGLRGLVVRGFRKSIPDYQKIDGLTRKMYCLTQDGHFGGLYLWQSDAKARRWFNDAWFARIQKTYGQPGTITYYQVLKTTDFVKNPAQESSYQTVLSVATPLPSFASGTPGLLRIIEIRDSGGKPGVVSVWQTEAQSTVFFRNSTATNTIFDTPILLDNAQ